MIVDWFRGLNRSTQTSLSKTKIPTATLANWDPLLHGVMERVSHFDQTDLFMIRFRNPRSNQAFGEHPTLVIGAFEPLIAPKHEQGSLFINASGLVDSGTVPGTQEIGWNRAGFHTQKGKRGDTFGKGPMSFAELPAALVSALDVFAMFYGVSERSAIVTLGDPEFEQILDRTDGIRRTALGSYQLT